MWNFLFHGLECCFWCFIWHNVHHAWHKKHDDHYEVEKPYVPPVKPTLAARGKRIKWGE